MKTAPDVEERQSGPQATLAVHDGVAITIGIVLGAGIFRAPSIVAQGSSSAAGMLVLWLAGGLIALLGALCYAELAAAWPNVGGDYHFLRRAYGRKLALLYAWARLAVIQTGSVAVLAFVFGDYLAAVLPIGEASAAIYAASATVAVTALNWAGLRPAVGAQKWLVPLEVGGLIMVIAAGLFVAPGAPAPAAPPPSGAGSVGLAMVFVLLTYGGWSEAAFVSAELRGGGRRVLPVLLISLAVLTSLFLLVNLAYVRVLGLDGVAASRAVGADVMQAAFGPVGSVLLAVAVALAALTSANATIITGARSAYALGQDVRVLRWLGRWHAPSGSPRNALLAQGAVVLTLVLAGGFARDGFQTAVDYTAPTFWFFFLLTGASLIVLRQREPGRPRPFRVPLYPLLPLAFCAANAWLLWSSLVDTGWGALVGVGVVATGGLLLPLLDLSAKGGDDDR
ncbi:APC family permease [uncultured Sphingomonas sp.]|uniref:APC family permease n=1 Tax=uncultured Sphingomonas sp. TaxID=158754 RepID=UPI0035CB633D